MGSVTLSRGVVTDQGFADWAQQVAASSPSGPAPTGQGDGFSKISGIQKTEDITLKRGVIQDDGFANWVNSVVHGNYRFNALAPQDYVDPGPSPHRRHPIR